MPVLSNSVFGSVAVRIEARIVVLVCICSGCELILECSGSVSEHRSQRELGEVGRQATSTSQWSSYTISADPTEVKLLKLVKIVQNNVCEPFLNGNDSNYDFFKIRYLNVARLIGARVANETLQDSDRARIIQAIGT